ncbi:MAG TPA: helix-turn-helix domain-containing protein [Acidimicrobiia bacterium]|jgi:AcrR family transcriptional regulator
MSSDASSTRDKLLDTATRLYAERGIENVSLAEIVREAGQRNMSAIHYHFGGRDDLLRAILELYVPVIRARRLELLAVAEATPAGDVRSVAEAIVRPVTELAQRGWRERAYLQIGSELLHRLDRAPRSIRALLRQTAGYETMALLAQRMPPLPPDIWAERSELLYPFIGRAAADRARLLDRRGRGARKVLADDRFVNNLVDMVVGAVSAPVTDAPVRPAPTHQSARRAARATPGSGVAGRRR